MSRLFKRGERLLSVIKNNIINKMDNKNVEKSFGGFFKVYPGKPLSVEEKKKKLYHYTSFDTFVKIWLSKKLKFGMISEVNDMQECLKKLSSTPERLPLLFALQDIMSSYKQISFTMDYDTYVKGCMSPTMWAHYGDKRRGVCIEFDFDKLHFPNNSVAQCVNYLTHLPYSYEIPTDVYTINDLKQFIDKNINDLFFTKSDKWCIENEFRIICNTAEYLDVQKAITAIYLTSFESQECLWVEQLVANAVPVNYVHYGVPGNVAVPCVCEAKSERDKFVKSKNDSKNALVHMMKQARDFYEKNKHDENANLLLNGIENI